EHRVAELGLAVADPEVAVGSAEPIRSRRPKIHEAPGFRDREGPDEDLVVQRKHRRRRADAEREHDDHDERETGTQLELAQREFELIHDSPRAIGLAVGGTRPPCRRMSYRLQMLEAGIRL